MESIVAFHKVVHVLALPDFKLNLMEFLEQSEDLFGLRIFRRFGSIVSMQA